MNPAVFSLVRHPLLTLRRLIYRKRYPRRFTSLIISCFAALKPIPAQAHHFAGIRDSVSGLGPLESAPFIFHHFLFHSMIHLMLPFNLGFHSVDQPSVYIGTITNQGISRLIEQDDLAPVLRIASWPPTAYAGDAVSGSIHGASALDRPRHLKS